MLDFFTIFSKGGILLWCFNGVGLGEKELRGFTPAVNTFIKTVLLQEKSGRNVYETGSLAIKYKLDNEFELVFVVGYQKMLPLLYLDKLLDEIQLRFRDQFSDDLKEQNYFNRETFSSFTADFEKILTIVESSAAKQKAAGQRMKSFDESQKSQKTIASLIENPSSNASSNNNGANKVNANNKKNVSITAEPKIASIKENIEPNLDEETRLRNLQKLTNKGKKSPAPEKTKSPKAEKTGKKNTTWDPFLFGGRGATGEEAKNLERGPKSPKPGSGDVEDLHLRQYVPDESVIGHSANIGELAAESDDDDEEVEELLTDKKSTSGSGGAFGGLWSSLSSLVGSKSLTRKEQKDLADIEPVIGKMKDHLIGKNVAADVAGKLCESVAAKLEGKVMGTFQSIHRTVRDTLTESLLQLLTPKRRVDILRDIVSAKKAGKPYVITFCGVNGVGKSTNLAKICFWLIENKCRVLIAACDTFRAGAVEQLRTHMRRLNSLHPSGNSGEKQAVELYEKGYGKDAAGIAMEAINYARTSKIDVVLVDTAGRMQDNGPLMRALAKLIAVNDPDLVLFVGEALVGNEAVDQLVKFNAALADNSSNENPHLIDGIVLTKFDTIDDKVGSAISMTYITGQPIIFVGTGQTYTDLKNLNAKAVVQALMK